MTDCTGVGPYIVPPDDGGGKGDCQPCDIKKEDVLKVLDGKDIVGLLDGEDILGLIDKEDMLALLDMEEIEISKVDVNGKTVTAIVLGRIVESDPARLPEEYQEVEYITSPSSETAYIDTGLMLDGSYSFYVVGRTKENGSAIFIDAYNSSSERQGGILYNRQNPRYDYWWPGVGYSRLESDGMDYTQKFALYQDASGVRIEQDGKTSSAEYTGTTITSGAAVRLLSSARSDLFASSTILYAARIYRGGEALRDFVPAVRKADQVAGMYDLVTKTFYASAGTGDLIAGPEV